MQVWLYLAPLQKASRYYLGFWTQYHVYKVNYIKLIFSEISLKDCVYILMCEYMVIIRCKNILKSAS